MRDEVEVLAVRYGLPLVIALVVVSLRALLSAKRWHPLGILRGVLMACLVAWLLPPWLDSPALGLDYDERWFFVAIAAVFIEDFILFCIKLGGIVREDPIGALRAVAAFILRRGK